MKAWDAAPVPPRVIAQMISISAEQIIWGGNFYANALPPRMGWLYWSKGQDGLTMSDGELAWTSRDKALRAITINRAAIQIEGAEHPTQKPVALMEWCLGFLPDARTILDPFLGSGTTLVACQRLGRMGTGIEIDPEYFDIACRRVEEAARQPDLFVAAPEQPKQEAFNV